MKVLVACEESQRVCKAFRALGHEAFSADLQRCSGGRPEWHIQGDVVPLLSESWDLIIAFPPCTFLSKVGSPLLYPQPGQLNFDRYNKGLLAREFFMKFYTANCPRIAIENPVPNLIYHLPPCTQYIQPFEFGEPYTKKTCLWLKGLPKLKPTGIVTPTCSWLSKTGYAKTRSKTFTGIASAMAYQWGSADIQSNNEFYIQECI